MLDVLIVGGGPAGLSCAIAAHKKHLTYRIIEKGNIVDAIIKFPVNMTFFSTADQLELADIPFTSAGFRPTRQEVVRYYHNIAAHFNLNVQSCSKVEQAIRKNGYFEIKTVRRAETRTIEAKTVILATGFYDNPNLLNIPGETLPHVSHYYREAFPFFGQKVVVVGGKNSAVEAALELFRGGADVTILHRRPEIKESVKYWILPDILNRLREGKIKGFFNAQLEQITPDSVKIVLPSGPQKLPADAVFLLTGYQPDTGLLDSIGIAYHPESLEPVIDTRTNESNIPGLYLAGSVIAGKNPNRIFIENSREHGDLIIPDILSKLG